MSNDMHDTILIDPEFDFNVGLLGFHLRDTCKAKLPKLGHADCRISLALIDWKVNACLVVKAISVVLSFANRNLHVEWKDL